MAETPDDASEEDFTGSREEWLQYWSDNVTPWHSDYVDPILIKHVSTLTRGMSGPKVLFPLCGKDPGMKFLLGMGCEVFGIELSPIGCKSFFVENQIDFIEEKSFCNSINEYITVFKSKTAFCKLTIYCCDFYKLPTEIGCDFDAIWDRGAMYAINDDDLNKMKYVTAIKDLMTSNCINLTVIEDETSRDFLTLEEIQECYGNQYDVVIHDRLKFDSVFGTGEVFIALVYKITKKPEVK